MFPNPIPRMNNTVGALVRKFRLEQSQTQLAFAELLGVCERHYRKLEKGQRAFLFEHLMTLAEVFNVDIKMFYPPLFFNKIHSKRSDVVGQHESSRILG